MIKNCVDDNVHAVFLYNPHYQMYEEQCYRNWWDRAKQITPPVKLAKKLGYQNEPQYYYVWWAK